MAKNWENISRAYSGGQNRRTSQGMPPSGHQAYPYVEGNTVRKASAVPKQHEEPRERQKPKRYPQQKPVRMPGISGRAFLFLVGMLCAPIYCGFSYLTTQEDVRQIKKEIVSLQSEVIQQKTDNEEEYQAIVETVDLSEVYQKATRKLKMVQAKNNQIYTYKNKKSDMVKQYGDIPGAEK